METTKTAYFAIQNRGEIDVNAFRLIGASTKRGDSSKIGHFGSGLKYAIAVLLRHSVGFRVFSGMKEIKVSTSQQSLGDQKFDVIKFNNKLTSLTTEMGIDWKLWFALREIYCNAIDEGGLVSGLVDGVDPKEGTTTFYLELNEQLNDVFLRWSEYFSEKREDLIEMSHYGYKFFAGSTKKLLVYRKGIQVLERENTDCLFHYDFNSIAINESRTVVSEFELEYETVKALQLSANEQMIARIYDNIKSYEARLNWSLSGFFSQKWLDVLGGRIVVLEDTSGYFLEEISYKSNIILPNRLAMALKEYFGEKVKICGMSEKFGERMVREQNEKENRIINDCLDFLLEEVDCHKYPIKICDFENRSQLGEAHNGTILLSPHVFDFGKRMVIATILEEYWHLESQLSDKTRAFQDFLINRFIDQVETKKQIFL